MLGVGRAMSQAQVEKEETKSETDDTNSDADDEPDVLDPSGDTERFKVYTKADAATRAEFLRKSVREAIGEMHEEIETDTSDTTSASSDASASDACPVLSGRDAHNLADGCDRVVKLDCALYDLKQTGRQWNAHLVDELV